MVGTALRYAVWSGATGWQGSIGALSGVQTVLIELRKWLGGGAASARQPGLVFHCQKQTLEVQGTSKSTDTVGPYPRYNTAGCSAQQKKELYCVNIKEKYLLRKVQAVSVVSPRSFPHALPLETCRFVKKNLMFLAHGAQKDNLMADDCNTSPNGNCRGIYY